MSGVAVVTGAARGIGAATTRLLASRGWRVLAVDIAADDPALPYPLASRAELAATVESAGDNAAAYIADVRSVGELRSAVDAAVERWGRLDAAIACAGVIGGGMPTWELATETERAVIEIDLGGVLNLARAVIPALLARPEPRSGRIVAVASAAATRGMYQLTAYCAAKAGVVGAVRAMATELAGTGVTVNAVSPGSTDTAILAESARLYSLTDPIDFAAQQPIGRLLRADEVAATVAYLVVDEPGAITGANIAVDGGLTL